MANRYMHTLDGKPAYFDGEQLIYADNGVPMHKMLTVDLAQIRREQRRSTDFRNEHGWPVGEYDYIRFTTEKH